MQLLFHTKSLVKIIQCQMRHTFVLVCNLSPTGNFFTWLWPVSNCWTRKFKCEQVAGPPWAVISELWSLNLVGGAVVSLFPPCRIMWIAQMKHHFQIEWAISPIQLPQPHGVLGGRDVGIPSYGGVIVCALVISACSFYMTYMVALNFANLAIFRSLATHRIARIHRNPFWVLCKATTNHHKLWN